MSPLLREGIEKTIKVVPSREPIQDQIFWKQLDDEILYLRLDNFMDEGAISRVYQECLPMMTEVKFLLIDVRQNGGGTDSLYIPLLHLGLEKDQGYEGIDWDDDGMEILYTERNVDLRLKDFEDWMQQEEISPETVKLLEDMKEDLIHHRGKAMYRISKKARNSSQRLEVATILNRSLSYQIFIVLHLGITLFR